MARRETIAIRWVFLLLSNKATLFGRKWNARCLILFALQFSFHINGTPHPLPPTFDGNNQTYILIFAIWCLFLKLTLHAGEYVSCIRIILVVVCTTMWFSMLLKVASTDCNFGFQLQPRIYRCRCCKRKMNDDDCCIFFLVKYSS